MEKKDRKPRGPNKQPLTKSRKRQAIQLLAQGEKQIDIAKQLDITPRTMSKFYTKPGTQALIVKEAERYLAGLPDVVKDALQTIEQSANTPLDPENPNFYKILKMKKLAQEQGRDMLKATKIIPTSQSKTTGDEFPVTVNIQAIRTMIYNKLSGQDDDPIDV